MVSDTSARLMVAIVHIERAYHALARYLRIAPAGAHELKTAMCAGAGELRAAGMSAPGILTAVKRLIIRAGAPDCSMDAQGAARAHTADHPLVHLPVRHVVTDAARCVIPRRRCGGERMSRGCPHSGSPG